MRTSSVFRETVWRLALPVMLQSMLQSSFSLVDQVMIGQLGSVEVAAIGLAGKFVSILTVVLAAVASVAGILLAQAIGAGDRQAQSRGFYQSLLLSLGIAVVFMGVCFGCPDAVMGIYSRDPETVALAAAYLRHLSWGFLPTAVASLLSTLLRCREKASLPFYAGIAMALVNTAGNYLLIFGKLGLPAMGVEGAALATSLSQVVNCLLLLAMLHRQNCGLPWARPRWTGVYLAILLPMLLTELVWSLGENVYGVIYGHLGTDQCAAMTLLNPVQSMVIGALSGLSQAASILVGKELGGSDRYRARQTAGTILRYGLCGSAALSVLLVAVGQLYLSIYAVEPGVIDTAWQILLVYAVISPVKVQNMILGGVLRSGGEIRALLYIDLIGTWCIGVPLGLLAAFVWGLRIPWVYLLLSLEECVRLALGFWVFHRDNWMRKITA